MILLLGISKALLILSSATPGTFHTGFFFNPNNAKTYYLSQIYWYFYFLSHSYLVPFTFYFTFFLWNHWSSTTENLQGEEKIPYTIKGSYTPSTHIHTIKISLFSIQRNGKPAIFQIPHHNNYQNHIHSLWKLLWTIPPCSLVQKSGLTRWKPCPIMFT